MGKTDGKAHSKRPNPRLEDNTKVKQTEIWCEDADYIHLAQERVQWWAPVENRNEHSGFIQDGGFLD